MAIVGLLAVLTGFAKTFIIPAVTHTFSAPFIIHVHGAFASAWILLFLTQTFLIHFHRYNVHRVLGYSGIFIAAGVVLTMVPAGLVEVNKNLAIGFGDSAYSSILGVITSGILFFSFMLAGILKRTSPETHKRLLLLATIVVLWPAWFRFRHYFPSVPHPEIWFALVLADSLIVVAWIWDKMRNGVIHPSLKYGGLFIILEQSFEVMVYDSPWWRQAAIWIYDFL